MLKKLQSKRQEGFTIIEVLIVLAIAGLILLVVFLAVPALQRNSRNTQRRNDIANVLGAVNEYAANNAGALPTAICSSSPFTTVTVGGGTTCPTTTNPVNASVSGQFTGFGVAPNATAAWTISAMPATAPASGAADNRAVTLYTGGVCNGNSPTATGAGGRAIAAYFAVEPDQDQCVSS